MKKFILLSVASIAFTPAAFSHEGHSHHADKPRPFTGLQVMMGVGGIIAGLETTQEAESNAVTPLFDATLALSDDITNDADLFQSNIAGQLSLGYTYQFANGFVLGAFAVVGATNIEFDDTVEDNGQSLTFSIDEGLEALLLNTNTRLETTYDYDIALLMKPGFLIGKRTWLYGMLGPRWGHFNSSYHLSVDAPAVFEGPISDEGTPMFPSASADSHASQYAVGFTAGVGFAQLLTKHVMLGLEYTYTAYGEFDVMDVSDTNTLICFSDPSLGCIESSVDGSATIEPNINTVMATLSYKF